MKKPLVLNFKPIPDPQFQLIVTNVVAKMAGNKYFPDAGPMVNEMSELIKEFRHAMAEAHTRDIYKVEIKNRIKLRLIEKMKQLGEHVINVAKGSQLILISSGFHLAKHNGQAILTTPTGFKIMPGRNNGEIIMQLNRVLGAKTYLYQYTPHPVTEDSTWQIIYCTRCKKTLKNLPLGENFWFRMAAIGAHDQIVYTELLNRYIS